MPRPNAKSLIQAALMELLEERALSKIDVQDIAAKCGLSRQTFYYNFKNKQDLLQWILQENNQQALDYFNNGGTLYDFLYNSMLLMQDNRLFYESLAADPAEGRSFADYFEQGIVACAKTIEDRCAIGKMNGKLWSSLHFFTFGAKGMLTEWVETGMKQHPRQIAEVMMKSMPCRVDNYFQQCH